MYYASAYVLRFRGLESLFGFRALRSARTGLLASRVTCNVIVGRETSSFWSTRVVRLVRANEMHRVCPVHGLYVCTILFLFINLARAILYLCSCALVFLSLSGRLQYLNDSCRS